MRKTFFPDCLWDYCCILATKIKNLTANNYYASNGRTAMEIVTGDTPNIAEYMAFQWYQPIWYIDGVSFPEDKKKFGRWLGVSHQVGQSMCFWVLTENATAISQTSVQPISSDEFKTKTVIERMKEFDRKIDSKIGNHKTNNELLPFKPNHLYILDQEDDYNEPIQEELTKDDEDNISGAIYDKLLTAEVTLPSDDHHISFGKVTGYKRC
jgi:hypothetical protein